MITAVIYVRLLASLLLIGAGLAKISRRRAFASAVDGYALVPSRWAPWIAGMLPEIELATGVMLVSGVAPVALSLGAATLFAMFGAAVAVNLASGRRDVSCGCFGGRAQAHTTWIHVGGNALLATALSSSAFVTTSGASTSVHLSAAIAVFVTVLAWWLANAARRMWRQMPVVAARS